MKRQRKNLLGQNTEVIWNKLQSHVGTRQKIRVETQCSCQKRLNGYLLGLSDQLGLLHCFHDFMPDGYIVFRLAYVETVRSNEYERFWDRMLAAEGLLSGVDEKPEVDLTSFGSAIRSISNHFQMMIIESQFPGEESQDFYIGQVVSLKKDEVVFDHFDGLGRWESEPSVIPLREISFVQFATPYIEIFGKYLDGPRPSREK